MKKNTVEKSMFYGASPDIFTNAKELRNNMTLAEKMLWEKLRSNSLNGLRFKAQHPISRFIADFYCHSVKLVIEIDGGVHQNEEISERDMNRTCELNKLGLKVIRFTNEEVLNDIERVIEKIEKEVKGLPF